jgi:Flp pilus assembly protein TadB
MYVVSRAGITGGKITLIMGVALQVIGVFIIYRMMAATEDSN